MTTHDTHCDRLTALYQRIDNLERENAMLRNELAGAKTFSTAEQFIEEATIMRVTLPGGYHLPKKQSPRYFYIEGQGKGYVWHVISTSDEYLNNSGELVPRKEWADARMSRQHLRDGIPLGERYNIGFQSWREALSAFEAFTEKYERVDKG